MFPFQSPEMYTGSKNNTGHLENKINTLILNATFEFTENCELDLTEIYVSVLNEAEIQNVVCLQVTELVCGEDSLNPVL